MPSGRDPEKLRCQLVARAVGPVVVLGQAAERRDGLGSPGLVEFHRDDAPASPQGPLPSIDPAQKIAERDAGTMVMPRRCGARW